MFGDLLRQLRQTAGLTQEELAERAQVSARAISDLERGARGRPWRETVQLLANALQLGAEQRAQLESAARPTTPHPPDSAPAPAPAAGEVARPLLPSALTSFVGREHEEAAIVHLLQRLSLAC
jgi:transcriptional regulator with XRE-family HTH domain